MQIRDILLVLHGANAGEQRLAITMALACRHGARVTGFCPLDLVALPPPALAMAGYGEAMLTEAAPRPPGSAGDRAEVLEHAFRAEVARNLVAGTWVTGDADPPRTLVRLAHNSDLVVIGQPDPESQAAGRIAELIEHLLLESGRPVLLVPYAGTFDAIGTRVLIGWTETREAARAVHDALPLFAKAQAVTALTLLDSRHAQQDEEPPAAELARHLQRHGIAATAARSVTDGIAGADALLSYACDLGADLVVMGGYGHSPLRERLIGGMTRSLLQHMTVPVLMSH